MENKQMAYFYVPHQNHNYTAKGNGGNEKSTDFGTVGSILIIVVLLIIWIILKKLYDDK